MIEFVSLRISGFFNIPSSDPVTVPLDVPGLNLVLGENGAGKSSRYTESLFWVLYGDTLRGLKTADGVINKDSSVAEVELSLRDTDSKEHLRIVRTKGRGRAQALDVTRVLDSTGSVPLLLQPLFPSANLAEKQARLEEWLGLDATTFQNSVVFGQGATALFAAGLSDVERKAVFDRICGLDEYDRAFEVAQSFRRSAEVDATVRQTRYEEGTARLATLRGNLAAEEKKLADLAAEIEASRESMARQIEDTQRELEAAQAAVEKGKSDLQAARDAREALPPATGDPDAVRDRKEALGIHRELTEQRSGIERSLRSERATMEAARLEVSRLAESVRTSKCTYCGSVLSNVGAVQAAQREREVAVLAGEARVATLEDQLAALSGEIAEVEGIVRGLGEAVLGASKAREAATARISGLEATLSAMQLVVESKAKHLSTLGGAAEALLRRRESAEQSLRELEAGIREKEEDVAKLREARDEAAEKLAVYQFWEEGFGPKGIKAFLIENVLPLLNRRINEHLGYLSDGGITARVTATTALKKGGVAERLSVDVLNSSGADVYGGNSGGERRRIDLAILLALQDLVGSRASRAVNFCAYDEVLDALDEAGTTKAVNYLKVRAEGKPTFLISHSEHTKALVEDLIRV